MAGAAAAADGWDLGGGAEPVVIGFYLVPGFPLLSVSAAIDPLRQANRLSGRTLYRWVLISADGGPVRSSAGVDVAADGSIDTAPPCHLVIVCAGLDTTAHYSRRLFSWFRRLRRQACRLGAISTGAYLLAQAGMLDGRRCAVHWEAAAEFQDAFPRCRLTRDIFSVDGPFITSSGGTVTLDMMLYIVEAAHGRPLAAAISEQLNHSRIRLNDEAQRMRPQAKFGITHANLCEVIRLMEEHIDAPLDLATLARRVALSRRQLERLFRTHLKDTPSGFYLRLRMERARTLITQSTLGLPEIARNCGYETLGPFGRMYRRQFGITPAQARRGAGL
ncbi:transcriptional regulator GlxA family with amidase domain [Angulomicrobium tetraedrale]|uniref:Transcriptional regulator GlxA family with amidase domain n=1 Tax=Ancylobacter tetraedralis TaxID=217068 RepID=A0A839Z7E7_9HYPH|nr:GlxA family transcriptional regulator [Ancylobacter tetraedralis]MBB3770376.1 transcriptional regulator GlxA family with amidase domain [Ancylobacter tetraedralis]